TVAGLADPAHAPVGHAADRLTPLPDAEQLARPRPLRVGLLGNLSMGILEEAVVVVADRAHGVAARAVAEGADDAQEPLPDAEPLVAAERAELCCAAVAPNKRAEDADDRGEAELLSERRAQALVESPVLDGVGRAGIEAAGAGLADAELLGELAGGLEHRVGENDRRVAARSRLFRQQVQLEPDRAEPGLDGDVACRDG